MSGPARPYDPDVRTLLLVLVTAVVLFGVGLLVGLSGGADDAPLPVARGDAGPGAAVEVTYPDVDGELAEVQAGVRESGVMEAAADSLTEHVALPQELTVEVTSCEDGTGYLEGEARVEICLEDLLETREELTKAGIDDVPDVERGIWRETALHESGHAVIDLLALPYTGREEDVADQFAAWMLGAPDADDAALAAVVAAAEEYRVLAETYEQEPADEHTSDAARAVNYLCYAYGADPDARGDLVQDTPLTQERADGCADEWDDLDRGWRALLDDAGALRP